MEKHGVKLGFMSAFVKASADALHLVPAANAVIDGDEIVYRWATSNISTCFEFHQQAADHIIICMVLHCSGCRHVHGAAAGYMILQLCRWCYPP